MKAVVKKEEEPKVFQPFVLSITIETEKEALALTALGSISLPVAEAAIQSAYLLKKDISVHDLAALYQKAFNPVGEQLSVQYLNGIK